MSVKTLIEGAKAWNADEDWVVMRHPATGGETVATRESVEQEGGHASRGWVIVEDDSPDAGPTRTEEDVLQEWAATGVVEADAVEQLTGAGGTVVQPETTATGSGTSWPSKTDPEA